MGNEFSFPSYRKTKGKVRLSVRGVDKEKVALEFPDGTEGIIPVSSFEEDVVEGDVVFLEVTTERQLKKTAREEILTIIDGLKRKFPQRKSSTDK